MFKDMQFIFDKSYFFLEKNPILILLIVVLLIILITIILVRKEIKKL